jgi:hypothetical protein
MRRSPRRRGATASFAALVLALAGCGGDESGAPEAPPSGFERALATIGEGVSPSGSGFGWLDLKRLGKEGSAKTSRLALALGPGADDLLARPAEAKRALGADPRDASEAVSISGSYTLGVRLDGVPGGPLARRLRTAGAKEGRIGGWRTFDLGGWSESQVRGPLAALGPYASRVATRRDAVILTRFAPARDALTGRGTSPLEDPAVTLAAACLGAGEAARTMPAAFTHNKATSPDLLAVGMAAAGTETICAIDGSEDEAARRAESMRAALEPRARDPITGERLGELVADVRVDAWEGEGGSAARATLRPAPGAPGAFVFGALVRGSLLTYTGSTAPIPPDVARRLRRDRAE